MIFYLPRLLEGSRYSSSPKKFNSKSLFTIRPISTWIALKGFEESTSPSQKGVLPRHSISNRLLHLTEYVYLSLARKHFVPCTYTDFEKIFQPWRTKFFFFLAYLNRESRRICLILLNNVSNSWGFTPGTSFLFNVGKRIALSSSGSKTTPLCGWSQAFLRDPKPWRFSTLQVDIDRPVAWSRLSQLVRCSQGPCAAIHSSPSSDRFPMIHERCSASLSYETWEHKCAKTPICHERYNIVA